VQVHWTGAADEPVVIGFHGLRPEAAGGLALAGGVLTAGPLRSAPRVQAVAPTGYASGIRKPSATAGLIGSRGIGPGCPGRLSGSPAADRVSGFSGTVCSRVLGPAVLVPAVVGGPGLVGPGGGDARSAGETVGVGGSAVLRVGTVFLAGGTVGAVSAAGAGGLSANRLSTSEVPTIGSALAGASAGGSMNAGAGIRGPAGPGGQAGSPNNGNSMIQGGQIGLSGRPLPGSAGYLPGGPAAAGSAIGGAHAYRVTWLVEDRDLYGVGPTVAPVIESAPVALAAAETSGEVVAVE